MPRLADKASIIESDTLNAAAPAAFHVGQ